MLKVCGLKAERDDRILFSNLTFELAPGALLMVTGPNGSGKSTLLKILVGLLSSIEGSVTWQSKPFPLSGESFAEDISGAFLYLGHKTGIQPALTPIENLKWFMDLQTVHRAIQGTIRRSQQKIHILSALQAVGLAGYEDVPCETLSCGQRQRVALARLWLEPAKIWILDEPFTALDALAQILLYKQFLAHLKAGGLIIMASHLNILSILEIEDVECIPQKQIKKIALGFELLEEEKPERKENQKEKRKEEQKC